MQKAILHFAVITGPLQYSVHTKDFVHVLHTQISRFHARPRYHVHMPAVGAGCWLGCHLAFGWSWFLVDLLTMMSKSKFTPSICISK
jgi:hypothetical protein